MDGTVAAHLPKFKSHFVPNPLTKDLGHQSCYLLGQLTRIGLGPEGPKDPTIIQSCQADMWPFRS